MKKCPKCQQKLIYLPAGCQAGDYDAFEYDSYNGICYCYKNKEIVYQEYIG